MLDKSARKMLNYMIDQDKVPNGSMWFEEFYDVYGKYSGMPDHQMMACIRYLEQEGYISPACTSRGVHVGFQVEHKGYQYEFFQYQETKAYIADKWIDFVSLLISFAALAISAIALLRTIQG